AAFSSATLLQPDPVRMAWGRAIERVLLARLAQSRRRRMVASRRDLAAWACGNVVGGGAETIVAPGARSAGDDSQPLGRAGRRSSAGTRIDRHRHGRALVTRVVRCL